MDRFAHAFREVPHARKELRKASLRRQRAGRPSPSLTRGIDRYAAARHQLS